jgi:hypothetical protein
VAGSGPEGPHFFELGACERNDGSAVAICRRCKHRRLVFSVALAERLGEMCKIAELQQRLRCGGRRGYSTGNLHGSSK